MSRLTDLIQATKAKDPTLGAELEREFKALSSRRSFGLNFERHRPEAVELPQRPARKGDKVRIIPPRGSTEKGDQRLWRVTRITKGDGGRTAHLGLIEDDAETATASAEDLVVVAEFRDPIYPGLVSTGKVERGGNKPFHTVINAENYHALKALTFTHKGKVDAIYIDPPYNTGAKDWKYNNDYVEGDDLYRHSKWLAFMERRLLVAKQLLNPERSVLIATIDEKEVHRLALLIEQIFPDGSTQMVTSIISAKGAVRVGQFSRVEEHLLIVTLGGARVMPWVRNMLNPTKGDGAEQVRVEWLGLRRREPSSVRGARPNQFYPIFVHESDGSLHSVGDPVPDEVSRDDIEVPQGLVALWPLKPSGQEMLWGLTPEALRRQWDQGYARVNRWKKEERKGTVQYLPGGTVAMIKSGDITVTGRAKDGSVIATLASDDEAPPPKRVWHVASHNAETGGTAVVSALLPGRRFPYPKSLYAVEDALRFYLADNPRAVVLDFFAGSGTTAHAVTRLNRQDGGTRQCISITNNEVSADEQEALRLQGLRPGDPAWEAVGICDHITKPRIEAAIAGNTPDGRPIEGDYKFTDEFPMAEGFEENAEFFTLTYEAPVAVGHNRAFGRIAPMLWLRAGARGDRIDQVPADGWAVADAYGVLFDLDQAKPFCDAVVAAGAGMAFVVTDDDRRFQSVVRRLPDEVEPVRLYESYLSNFRFVSGE